MKSTGNLQNIDTIHFKSQISDLSSLRDAISHNEHVFALLKSENVLMRVNLHVVCDDD